MSKKKFFILLVIFILPFLLSTIYFQYVSHFGGQHTVNYGELISPMQVIEENSTKGFWTFVIFAKECDEQCRKRLYSAETTRVLTNQEMRRIKTLYIGKHPLKEEHKPTSLVPQIESLYSQSVDSQQWQKIKEQFNLDEQQLYSNILLLDPNGHLMMRYPLQKQDPKKMLQDIKRLLKYSRIG